MRVAIVLFLTGCMNWESLPARYEATRTGEDISHTNDGGSAADGGHTTDGGNVTADGGADGWIVNDDDGMVVDGGTVDGAPPANDMSCTQYAHSNGLGKNWTDCVIFGTINAAQALKACAVSYGNCNSAGGAGCAGKSVSAFDSSTSITHQWVYSGNLTGKVITGDCTNPGTQTNWN